MSTGIIAYGINFKPNMDGEIELPWVGDDTIDDWWIKKHGYKPPFELFGPDGEWIDGVKPDRIKIDIYFEHRRKFFEGLPKIPVEMVIHQGYDDDSELIMAIPETILFSYDTATIIPDGFVGSRPEWNEILETFCKENEIKVSEKPGWLLTSISD